MICVSAAKLSTPAVPMNHSGSSGNVGTLSFRVLTPNGKVTEAEARGVDRPATVEAFQFFEHLWLESQFHADCFRFRSSLTPGSPVCFGGRLSTTRVQQRVSSHARYSAVSTVRQARDEGKRAVYAI